MSEHPMMQWATESRYSVRDIAQAVGLSESHLRNILARRKEPSLPLAKRLADLTDGRIGMDAFLKENES